MRFLQTVHVVLHMGHGKNADLSSDRLHLKIFRRLSKLSSFTPDWLSEMSLETCDVIRQILDSWWKQLSAHSSLFRNSFQDELIRDTRLSLFDSREYIRDALTHPGFRSFGTPLQPIVAAVLLRISCLQMDSFSTRHIVLTLRLLPVSSRDRSSRVSMIGLSASRM